MSFQLHRKGISAIAVSPNGGVGQTISSHASSGPFDASINDGGVIPWGTGAGLFATAGLDGSVRVWTPDTPDPMPVSSFVPSHTPPSCLSFNHDNSLLACGFGPNFFNDSVNAQLGGAPLLVDEGEAGGDYGGRGGDRGGPYSRVDGGRGATTGAGAMAGKRERIYEKSLVLLCPTTGEVYSKDHFALPAAVTAVKFAPRLKNVLALGLNESQIERPGGSSSGGDRYRGGGGSSTVTETIYNSCCQILRLPDLENAYS